jgi:hypothetical protein
LVPILLGLALLFSGWPFGVARAETAMLECVADASVPSTDGHAVELRLPQAILLNFRFIAIRGWAVTKATLLLHVAGGDPFGTLDISTIIAPWDEKKFSGINVGKLTFLKHAVENKQDGWIAIEVSPSLVELLAAGKGTGLAIRDRSSSKGHVIHSRESVQFMPYLIVEGKPR